MAGRKKSTQLQRTYCRSAKELLKKIPGLLEMDEESGTKAIADLLWNQKWIPPAKSFNPYVFFSIQRRCRRPVN
jgi:hypothetical protein